MPERYGVYKEKWVCRFCRREMKSGEAVKYLHSAYCKDCDALSEEQREALQKNKELPPDTISAREGSVIGYVLQHIEGDIPIPPSEIKFFLSRLSDNGVRTAREIAQKRGLQKRTKKSFDRLVFERLKKPSHVFMSADRLNQNLAAKGKRPAWLDCVAARSGPAKSEADTIIVFVNTKKPARKLSLLEKDGWEGFKVEVKARKGGADA